MHGILSVSSPSFDGDCSNVIGFMRTLGISGDATSNRTLRPSGIIENGCRIIVQEDSKDAEHSKALWKAMHQHFKLTCAHLKLEHIQQGCVFDVFAPSRCPSE